MTISASPLFELALALCLATSLSAHAQAAPAPAVDSFAHGYEHSPGAWRADDLHPGERPGLSVAAGFGGQFAGLGAQVAYYRRVAPAVFVVPFASLGTVGNDVDGFYVGPALGAMAMFGIEDHWLSAASFGLVGYVSSGGPEPRHVGAGFVTRGEYPKSIYAGVLELGREWMYRDGGLFRLLLGVHLIPDPAVDIWIFPSFTIGGGWKS